MSTFMPCWQPIRRCLLAPLLAVAAGWAISPADAANAWYDGATPVFRHIEVTCDIAPTARLSE